MASKTLKVTISGSFKASDNDIESFENVTGIIPALETEPDGRDKISKAHQMVIRRYAQIWVAQAKKKGPDGKPTDERKYKPVQRIRRVFVDSIEDNDERPNDVLGYVGKDIMAMNAEDLQDFAAANDLSAVPLYKTNDLVSTRRVAWSEYARKVLGLVGPEYMWTDENFNPNNHQPIIADDKIRRYKGHVAPIEETIDREMVAGSKKAKEHKNEPSGSLLTLPQLKAIADEKKISYNKNIGFDQLYKKVYGEAA